MLKPIRNRITPATVIATVALIFAMTGGAYAASKVLITSTKQISPKVLKALTGKTGPAGPAGPAGAPGAAGVGTAGAAGAAGKEGPAGKEGTAGKEGPKGEKGEKGLPGETGFTSTLPSGKTETGTWSIAYTDSPLELETWTAISFSIPLKEGSTQAFFVNEKETEELDEEPPTKPAGNGGCTGTLTHPTAPKGVLCVYTEEENLEGAQLLQIVGHAAVGTGYQSAGAYLDFRVKAGGTAKGRGNWAVTAP